jgi:hypothetical protein
VHNPEINIRTNHGHAAAAGTAALRTLHSTFERPLY